MQLKAQMPTCKQLKNKNKNQDENNHSRDDENDEEDENEDQSEQLSIMQTSNDRLVTKVRSIVN